MCVREKEKKFCVAWQTQSQYQVPLLTDHINQSAVAPPPAADTDLFWLCSLLRLCRWLCFLLRVVQIAAAKCHKRAFNSMYMYLYIYILYIYLSIDLSLYLSIYISIYLPIYLSTHAFIYPSIYISILSIDLVYLSYLSIYLPILSTYLPI